MPNFDTNKWYHIFNNQDDKTSISGTGLFRSKATGSVFYTSANLTKQEQQCQFYRVDSEYYVLRTSEGGANAFMGAMYLANETSPGHSRWFMTRGNVSDESIFCVVFMDSNIAATQNGERLSFDPIKAIIAEKFSTVNVCSECLMGGVSISIIAVIAFVLGLFLWLKRKEKQAANQTEFSADNYPPMPKDHVYTHEMYHDGADRHEVPSHHVYVEMTPQDCHPAELPSSPLEKSR
ncbi:hypothetical protein P280DRAFT_485574 [Massarina eburnea CBS 473.64]|uniref:Uncharacterized protein n=1 Tax=Massarina eburnea CBS 473.64 TaxID=1395130 RepID=A0A6A6RFU5_9PLEO|nr:hypothetical protein P280DRAFT_485574 [Massarina eburnea CBS 473.64]